VVYTDWRDQTSNILRVNADGTQLVQLTQDGVSYTPRWSPLGDQIAFLRKGSSDRAHIYLMDVNGENVLQLTEGEVEDGYMNNLAWSPDGRFLAFVRGEYDPMASIMDPPAPRCW
jgi:Tol biopolymer transport system component